MIDSRSCTTVASARMLTDRLGNAIASQGLYSRTFDLARFGELFRNGGVTPEGRRVVSEAWVRESTDTQPIPKGRYAYQWWGGPLPGSYRASGFQGQKISIAEDHCLTGVRLSHAFGLDSCPGDSPAEDPASYGFGTEFHAGEWNALYSAVAAHLGACEPGQLTFVGPARLSRRSALRRGALRVRLRAQGAAMEVRASAFAADHRDARIAGRTFSLRAGRARWVELPLTAAGRRIVRSDGRMALRLVARSAGAPARAASRRVVLR